MKESLVKTSGKLAQAAKSYSIKLIFAKTMYFISAMLISRGYIFGSCYPFGLSLSASVPGKMLFPTLIGSIFGYLVPLRLGQGMRYISTVISIAAIRWALSDVEKIKNHMFYTPMVVFMSSIVTGLAVNCADGFSTHGVLITFFECLVASIVSYFFDTSFKIVKSKKIYNLNMKELSCIVASLSVSLISLSGINIHGISIGRVLGITLTLVSAYCFGVIGGCIAGISVGVIFILPSFGLSYISGAYAFAGMICGAFSSFGRLGICISFTPAYLLLCLSCMDFMQSSGRIYELLFGLLVFYVLPNSVFGFLKNNAIYINSTKNNYSSDFASKRLKLISDCFASSCRCLEKIELEAESISKTSFEETGIECVKSYCSGCGMRKLCWDQNCKSTYFSVKNIIHEIAKSDKALSNLKNCNKQNEIIKRITALKRDFSSYEAVKNQTREFKSIAMHHFEDISHLLSDISGEMKCENNIPETALKIKKLLCKKNIKSEDILCKKINDKIFLNIKIGIFEKNKFDEKLLKDISSLIGRKMGNPIFNMIDNNCIVNIAEKKNYEVNFSVSQHACNGGKFCGDSCRCFEDEEGNFSVILSDGMGTGGGAAIEGTLAAELTKHFMKFGMNFSLALKIVNSVMLLNAKSETLAALDILSINLFNAEAKFIKAGSPTGFIIHENEIEKINFSSLPIGILSDVSSSSRTVKLNPGDIVVMVSDGVTDLGEKFVAELFNNMNTRNVSEISKYVVSMAARERKNTEDDDITAIAIKISEI